MRPTLDGFCRSASLAQEALTLFSRLLHHPTPQIRPSSAREGKKKRAHLYVNTHQQPTSQQRHPAPKKEEKKKNNNQKTQKKGRSTNIPTCRQTDRRHKAERRHTRSHLPGTQRQLTDKHTKQRAQSTAQPEVYFMQEYSKVCFTIQLNIKGGSIPLWSLTPQWTNPRHPPSAYSTQKVAERHC